MQNIPCQETLQSTMGSEQNTWTLNRIKKMLEDRVEESFSLEYKGAGALDRSISKNSLEITKDISAFANSSGGVLIYGISEHPSIKHLAGALDPIRRKDVSKEWLESIILTIQPKLEKVSIIPISVDTEHVIYVIEVEQSSTAHQARDHKYYRRWDFSSRPMEDYEIRDVMNRSKYPHIELTFKRRRYTPENALGIPIVGNRQSPEDRLALMVFGKNTGTIMGNYVVGKISIPLCLLSQDDIFRCEPSKDNENPEYRVFSVDNKKQDRAWMGKPLSDIRFEPILPELDLYLGNIDLDLDALLTNKQSLKVLWRSHCDNAPQRSGEIALGNIPLEDHRKGR